MVTPLRSAGSACLIRATDLKRFADGWILDCQYRQLSPQTIFARRNTLDKLLWWLRENELDVCSPLEIKRFLTYLSTGHLSPGGRFGNPQLTRPVRPRTVKDYYGNLRAFFRFLLAEEYLDADPMANLKPPVSRSDQIQPFSEEQVKALLAAAKRSKYPKRDEAILLFLLDTGVRASELCNLKMEDIDVVGKRAIVLGKGNKHRAVFFGRATAKALWGYVKGSERSADSPFFQTEKGVAFTRSGLLQLVGRLGRTAGIEAVRCSPHTFRHTAAVWFLRNGGQVFALKEMLGHNDLAMTNRYVAIAQADVQNQHRQYSPVERLQRMR